MERLGDVKDLIVTVNIMKLVHRGDESAKYHVTNVDFKFEKGFNRGLLVEHLTMANNEMEAENVLDAFAGPLCCGQVCLRFEIDLPSMNFAEQGK